MTPFEVLAPHVRDEDRVAVTGATGWFGRTALDLLDDLFGVEAPDRVTAFASREQTVCTRSGRLVHVRPLAELPAVVTRTTHVLHFAYLTRDRVADLGVANYVAANLGITGVVLRALQARPRSLLTTSSGAAMTVLGAPETDVFRNPYGFGKQLDELALTRAAELAGATSAVCRVYSVAGSYMTKPELYALGSLLALARDGGPLSVRARGPVVRSYTGVRDIVALLLWAGLTGRTVGFDSGGEAIEVGALAARIALAHGTPAPDIIRDLDPSVPTDTYVGRTGEIESVAAEAGLALQGLDALIAETAAWLAR